MRYTLKIQQSGSVLVSVIIVVPFLIFITTLFMNLTISSFRIAHGDQLRSHAQLAVDSGVDISLKEISEDESWTGTGGEITLQNSNNVKTTYETMVTNPSPDVKTITAIGRSYSPSSDVTPRGEVKVEVNLRPVSSGSYSIVTGVGGLYMSNSAKILGGDVYINGEVGMSNSAQIGLSTNPVNVNVAHQNCPNPPDGTYPRICNSGESGQPITINNSAHIYGSVKANNQTSSAGMSSPGLVAGSGVAAEHLPDHDRAAQKAAIATEITGSAASCWGTQTKTWAANTKITGNVTISNSCVVTVEGDIWITGNLYASNSTQIKASNSLGNTRADIMVDGSAGTVLSNSSKLVSNSSGTGFQIITYKSDAACSPDCTDVTGADLNNSRNDTTISLSNSSEGPNSIFYARWTRVQINNSGQIGAIVGQTIQLSNSATITFGTSVGTGTNFWIIDTYRRLFD